MGEQDIQLYLFQLPDARSYELAISVYFTFFYHGNGTT